MLPGSLPGRSPQVNIFPNFVAIHIVSPQPARTFADAFRQFSLDEIHVRDERGTRAFRCARMQCVVDIDVMLPDGPLLLTVWECSA